jgi:hypothetical protein|tara:strand:+ start:412 stop:693 length:282 start_codon:yes stop_codon:yes gene_type:complete
MIEITSNELYNEYLEYRSRLDVWKKNHGIFIKDIQKLERTVDALLNERLDELIMLRQTKRQIYQERADLKLQQAINSLKYFSKIELLTSLSKG